MRGVPDQLDQASAQLRLSAQQPELVERLEPTGVREGTGGEARVGQLEEEHSHQNKKYRWASGNSRAGAQVRCTPSARTS